MVHTDLLALFSVRRETPESQCFLLVLTTVNLHLLRRYRSCSSFFFQRLEKNVVGFVRTELKRFQEMVAPSHSDVLESRHVDEGERRSREAVLKITLDFLRRMEQDELSHLLQASTFLKMKAGVSSTRCGLLELWAPGGCRLRTCSLVSEENICDEL